MFLPVLATALLSLGSEETSLGVARAEVVSLPARPAGSGSGGVIAGTATSFPGLSGPPGSMFPTSLGLEPVPPDPTIAVGPDHIVETENSTLGIFDKATGVLLASAPLGFGGVFGPVGATGMVFDPRCLYDQYEGRFVVIGLSTTFTGGSLTASTVYIGISDDSLALGFWYVYSTPALTVVPMMTATGAIAMGPAYADFPGLGVDGSAVYVTANLYAPGSAVGLGVRGNLYRIFPKVGPAPMTGLYFGGPATYTDPPVEVFPLPPTPAAAPPPVFLAVKPAHHFGANPAAYFVSAMSTRIGTPGTFPTIRVQRISAPLGPSPTLCSELVGVPPYTTPTFGVGAPQPGTMNDLRVLLGELLNAVWRDGSLLTAHGVVSGGKTVARWYRLMEDVSSLGLCGPPFFVADSGEIDGGPGVHTFFPAIMVNSALDVRVVFALSSPGISAGVYFTGRSATDPPGVMALPITPLAAGTVSYDPPLSTGLWEIWGDYFGIALDPDDETTVWGCGEVALDATTWGTAIGTGPTCGTFTAYGTGLAGSGGVVPALSGIGSPVVGAFVSVELAGGLGGATGVLAISLASASVPLFGGTILVDLASAIFVPLTLTGPAGVPGAGAFSFPFAVPPLPGLEAFLQAGVFDPGASNGLLSLSNGLEICIG